MNILGLITPDSWRTDPVNSKKPSKKKPVTETVTEPPKTDGASEQILDLSSIPNKQQTKKISKPKRDKSLFSIL